MRYLLNLSSDAITISIVVSRISSVATVTVITVIYVFTVTAISTVIWNMVSVIEDIM